MSDTQTHADLDPIYRALEGAGLQIYATLKTGRGLELSGSVNETGDDGGIKKRLNLGLTMRTGAHSLLPAQANHLIARGAGEGYD